MKKYGDNMYKADKGKHFVLTSLGKEQVASYRHMEVGEPIDYAYADEYHAYCNDVDDGYIAELEDPNWVTLPGYKAVYDHKGYQLPCGNPYVYHCKEMAERMAKHFNEQPWRYGEVGYVVDAVYEGKKPREQRTYNGKTVYNSDYWFGDVGEVGDYVEQEIADWFLNCLPPRTWTTNMIQVGEPYSSVKEGTTYATLVRVTDDIWEYKGACLRGTTNQGTPIPYV